MKHDGAAHQRARRTVSIVLGRALKSEEEVHHVDEDIFNNANDNLVLCPNHKYHWLLHLRTRALAECRDASKRKCKDCKQYDSVEALKEIHYRSNNSYFIHHQCKRDSDRRRQALCYARKTGKVAWTGRLI